MKIGYKRVVVLFAVAWVLLAADASISGTWECTSTTPDGDQHPWKLVVESQGGKLTGKTVSARGEVPISDPKLAGDTFTFRSRMAVGEFEVSLKISSDRFEGTWKGTAEGSPVQGTVKGTRAGQRP